MATEYKLKTIKDIFDNVPADRLEDCMKELTKVMTASAHFSETLRMATEDLSGEPVPRLYVFPDEITWVDDGKGELTANFPDMEGKPLVRMEIRKSCQKSSANKP